MSLSLKSFAVKIKLTEDLLGTCPKDREVYASFIANKNRELMEKNAAKGLPPVASNPESTAADIPAAVAESVETIQDVEERGWTGFHSDDQGPFLYDYAVKGFLCEAARTLKQGEGEDGKDLKQLQDKVKRYLFVTPRRIRLPAVDGCLERPLRAMTAQGPRVTVVRSDLVKAGAVLSFNLNLLHGSGLTKPILADILEYGQFMGLGQWRSGGQGRFEVVSFE